MTWKYSDMVTDATIAETAFQTAGKCPFCRTELESYYMDDSDAKSRSTPPYQQLEYVRFDECPACGWWRIEECSWGHMKISYFEYRRGASAMLKKFNCVDVSVPLDEIRQYLTARYDLRFEVHPRVFEEVVASIFGGLGYKARVTSFTRDHGIDIILDGPNDNLIGVQVKRYRNSIKVEDIRALTGALVINGFTEGIFVTTSEFQAGCRNTASIASLKGYPIELIDANKLYDALKISQQNQYCKNREFISLYDAIPDSSFVNLEQTRAT